MCSTPKQLRTKIEQILAHGQSTKPVDKCVDGIALELVNPPDSLAFQRIAQELGISNRLIFQVISSLVNFVTAIIRKSLMIVNGC
jgi:hypothetical protein